MTTKTDITQERADFETAYAAAYPVAASLPGKFDREDLGDYLNVSVGIGWRMWQAGRAAQIHDIKRILNAAVEYADACVTRAVTECAGRPQSEQQIAAVAAEQAYADLYDLLATTAASLPRVHNSDPKFCLAESMLTTEEERS